LLVIPAPIETINAPMPAFLSSGSMNVNSLCPLHTSAEL
jgi:hypothetical protein